MIKAEQGGSMYDFVDNNYQSPPIEQKPVRECDSYIPEAPKVPVREEGWQQNREDNSKPYVNRDTPRHVTDSVAITQPDHSFYAFTRFVFRHPPRDSFEQGVNIEYRKEYTLPDGFNFIEEREIYIKFYRRLMGN